MPYEDPIARLAHGLAKVILDDAASLPPRRQEARVVVGLERVQPGLGARLVANRSAPIQIRLFAILYDHIGDECARLLSVDELGTGPVGLGATPPEVASAVEADDVGQHNDPPDRKKAKKWDEWQAHLYRGLWFPAYSTPISDLTPDDVGLASAYLAGKLSQKGCPKSDWAKHKEARANLAYRIVHGIEMIAGIVASVVLTIYFGPIGGALTGLLHRAKMKVIDHFWKEKSIRDPAFRAMLDKLEPTEKYTFNGFVFQFRPYGNLLLQELGCKENLSTRLVLHGRLMRTLDVLAASSPNAKSSPGRYDYPSAFGALKGSVFPPRGPQLDGQPTASPEVEAQAKKVIESPAIQAAINQPTASLTAMAQTITSGIPTPPGVAKAARMMRQKIEAQKLSATLHAEAQRPSRHWPWLVVGGAALGAAILATRS